MLVVSPYYPSPSQAQDRAIQLLNAQLEEKEERLREKDKTLREREEELQDQLQQKDAEIQRQYADIGRLQRELQVCMASTLHIVQGISCCHCFIGID